MTKRDEITEHLQNRAWLHMYSWAGYFAYPVEVLSKGEKFARVRLLHKTRIGLTEYPRGAIKHRVPLHSLSAYPSRMAYVSQGGGRFVGLPAPAPAEGKTYG
jgi:hypothetical protein